MVTGAGLLLAGLVAAGCRQAPRKGTPGGSNAGRAAPRDPTDPTTLRFHKVDLLISQWDVAQGSGRTDQAAELFGQIRTEVDAGFPDFLDAAAGRRGVQLQYLCVSALGFSARPEATGVLLETLGQPDPKLVGNALIALKLRADPSTDLLPVLQAARSRATEPRRYAPLAIASVLDARWRSGQGVDETTLRQVAAALSGVVADRDAMVRLHTARALGSLHGTGAYDLLMVLLKDEYVRIRVAAAASLEALGDPRGFPEVVKLLGNVPEDTKPIVKDILLSFGGRLRGRELTEDELETLGTSAQSWARWWEALRQARGWPVTGEVGHLPTASPREPVPMTSGPVLPAPAPSPTTGPVLPAPAPSTRPVVPAPPPPPSR